jgi:Polyketide cyclase / dehydrase and lipid transport
MPTFSHTLQVAASRPQIFGILDDVQRTPAWLTRCTGIDKLDDGPNTVGTRLRYHYKDGRRTGEMDGHITVHDPDEHVAMLYTDKLMDVTVDFVAAPGTTDGTTRLTHTIDIRPKGVGKVFGPLIKRSLPRQTTDAMDGLKALAESEAR